jgi:hypothetical protein
MVLHMASCKVLRWKTRHSEHYALHACYEQMGEDNPGKFVVLGRIADLENHAYENEGMPTRRECSRMHAAGGMATASWPCGEAIVDLSETPG